MANDFETLYQFVFFASVVILLFLERPRALQREPVRIARRWPSNGALFLMGSVVSAVVVPIGFVALAAQQPPGPMSRLGVPSAVQLVITFLVLDLWRYWEHRLFHSVPLLWRFHLVHHSDTQIDVTTSERHHPLEVLLGTALFMVPIVVLGLPATGVGAYVLTAAVVALYSHANLSLPAWIDCWLNRIVVTAPVHAVHHSDLQAQTDSNYGSVLTLWDRLFATFVDPAGARIPHFGLRYFHLPGDTGLWRVLQQPFLFRRDLPYPERDAAGGAPDSIPAVSGPRFALTRESKATLFAGFAGLALVTLAMGSTVGTLTAKWRDSEAYQYAWLVVPMVVYLIGWHRPVRYSSISLRPNFAGAVVVMIAAACWSAANLMNIDLGRQVAFMLALQGIAMATLGWSSYWQMFPTLALLFLMIPSGDILQPALRAMTRESITWFAWVAGLPHSTDGYFVLIGSQRYFVADECSGLASVTLSAFLGYCFGLLLYRPFFKVFATALLGAVLGFLANVLRVNAIVLIDWLRGSQMALTAHAGLQWIALFAMLGIMIAVLARLRLEPARPLAQVATQTPSRSVQRLAPVAAGLSAVLIAGGVTALQASGAQPPRANHHAAFAPDIFGWTLVDPPAVWTEDASGATESIHLSFRSEGHELEVLVVQTRSPDAKLPEPQFEPGDRKVWREKEVRDDVGCSGSHCVAMRHRIWQRDPSHEERHVYLTYDVGGFVTSSRLAVRVAHGWHRLLGHPANPRMVAFISDTAADVDALAAALPVVQSAVRN